MKKIILIFLFILAFSYSHNGSLRAARPVINSVSISNLFAVISHEHCTEPEINTAGPVQMEDYYRFVEENDNITETGSKIKKRTSIDLNIILPGGSNAGSIQRSRIASIHFPETTCKIFLLNSVFRL